MAALKMNDNCRHMPTNLRGIVEHDPSVGAFSVEVRITHVPPGEWFGVYGRPKIDDLIRFPIAEVRQE